MTSTPGPSRPIRTLLVANRGEIALRVQRTARRLGIRTVAVHTDLDAAAPHVRAADAAVPVPSYLDVEAVVAAAVASGADAVHPGYGFLSERAGFARALEEAGVRLVGPTSAVMEQMGRKDAARAVAEAAGVPVVPAYDVDDDPSTFAYPVLVKAAAGGGGKGMRVVRSHAEYAEGVAAARREALHGFGDDTLLVEKYVERGRHIEVQVVGDEHGTVVHLGERDCSTQRRHQKVLEEAPAPTLSADVRRQVWRAGVDLAAQVGYTGAGTVELLLDEASGDFYFLEMNTRLQVEHPVTEEVVRLGGDALDLVALQLRVAAGEPVGVDQAAVEEVLLDGSGGHAIEARVYAEDAFGGFLPQAGTAAYVRWPAPGRRGGAEAGAGVAVRTDHALESGQVVSTSYDPMLGKLVVHGPDREAARRGLVAALDELVVLGLTTNAGFLRALAASDAFRDATIDTAWLDRTAVPAPEVDVPRVVGAWVDARAVAAATRGAWRSDGWRIAGEPVVHRVVLDDVELRVGAGDVVVGGSGGSGGSGDGARRVAVVELASERIAAGSDAGGREVHRVELRVDGERVEAVVGIGPRAVEVVHRGQRHVLARPAAAGDRAARVGDGAVVAPMPGTVLEVRCSVGDVVAADDVLVVVEAMKMELPLRAAHDGTVGSVSVRVGEQVALGAALVEVVAGGAEDGPEGGSQGGSAAGDEPGRSVGTDG